MARGNLFLGMGRGSIGDVTFYRADGKQLSRVRNRNPRNPKTQAQLYQRAIMATVVKAYQAGKAIFDHAFQGYGTGAPCQRQFMSLNAKMLRQLVATDINTPLPHNQQKARVVAPGVSVPVANPFIISRGSYQQSFWSYNVTQKGYFLPAPTQRETVSEYVARVGLIANDIFTFVAFAELEQIAYQSPVSDDALSMLNYCNFGYVRMIVKSGLSDDSDELEEYGQLFDFQTSGGDFAIENNNLDTLSINQAISLSRLTANAVGYTGTGGIGVIRSRFDQDLRSDSALEMFYGTTADDLFGISSDYILDVWVNSTTSVGDSDLILEGGDA